MGDSVTTIRANDEVGPETMLAFRCLCPHTRHVIVFKKQIDDLVLHLQSETRELPGVTGEEIEEIPLRHERDYLAGCRQPREIRDRNAVSVNNPAKLRHFLVRTL